MEHATGAQRVGIVLSFLEACLFGIVAALHFGVAIPVGDETLTAPPLLAAAVMEAVIALALLLSVIVPGDGAVRAGRVMVSQILALIALFALHVGLLRGIAVASARIELVYAVAFALSLASIVLIASPAMRRRRLSV